MIEEKVHASPARFHSILFESPEDGACAEEIEAPDCFRDLNLDRVVAAITTGRKEYCLKPFFYLPLTDPEAVDYRQEIMKDLEREGLLRGIQSFADRMRAMREHLTAAKSRSYKRERERWFLDAVEIYCDAVEDLLRNLIRGRPPSRGLRAFQQYLAQYCSSGPFKMRLREAKKLKADLSAIRYCLLIKGSGVTVRNCDFEADFSAAVEATFAKFKQGAPKDYRVKSSAFSGMNHVDAEILKGVAQLNPEVFSALDDFCMRNEDFLDQTVRDFDREIQFYVGYLEYVATFKRAGLPLCYPHVSNTCKCVESRQGFDLALAGKLIGENAPVVCNDFALCDRERILVVTGPNQGGKTTFARAFGQMHYLASLGCPIPGTEGRFFLFDHLFTHFEREEDVATLRGKLEDDLVRMHRILEHATPDSVIILNEIFSSTTSQDAVDLGEKILTRISQCDALCVCVTFLDELASLNEKTVSAVAGVAPDDPTRRTYKIERRPADGRAYALALAEKYRLTYDRLKERIKP